MATQKELAKLAGVSAGTVSNVISGSTRVSERKRERVLNAVRALNYQPNLIARSLKTNRTRTLGIVVPDITIPFFPKIVRGAECSARERGYFLIVLDSEHNHAREVDMMTLLRSQRVEGILLVAAGGRKGTTESPASLASGPPVVYLDRLPEGPPFFPPDHITDQPERFLAAELIREKILRETRQEVPHSVAVLIEQWEEKPRLTRISALIYVERPGQKAIIIGAKGATLKKIGTLARQEMESTFSRKIFLGLAVKVRPAWREDPEFLKAIDWRAMTGV